MEKIVTYRYLFRGANEPEDKIGIKIVSDIPAEHEKLMQIIRDDESISMCLREYLGEYDLALIGKTESVKYVEKKEEN